MAMRPEEAVLHQRHRILTATTELVVERGYATVSVAGIVSLAKVSKSAFYREFEDKAAAFEAGVEQAWEEGMDGVRGALATRSTPNLEAALGEAAAMIVAEPIKARLVFVVPVETDAAIGARVREEVSRRHRTGLAAALTAEGIPEVPAVQLRGLVGGIEEVVYRRLHDGEPERLMEDMPTLAEWALGQAEALAAPYSVGERLLAELGKPAPTGNSNEPDPIRDWRADMRDPGVRNRLDRRERIVRATGQIVLSDGYAGLSVARISAVAGISNQTFHESFSNKDEAFVAAFEQLSLQTFRHTAEAISGEEDPLRGAVRGLVAMLDHIARDPIHQRLIFLELAGAGPEPLARAEAMLDMFVRFIEPDDLPAEAERLPPRCVREAIGGGIWTILREEIQAGRGARLVDCAAAIVDFAVLPFGVR